MSEILYRYQTPTPLTFAQMDANLAHLATRVRTPFYLNIPGSDSDPLLARDLYSNVWGNKSSMTTYSVTSGNNSLLRMWPFISYTTGPITSCLLWVSTANASTYVEFGLYDSDSNGFPTTKITGGSEVSLYYSGQTFASMPVTIVAGKVYWLAMNQAGSSGAFRGVFPPLGMLHWNIDVSGEYQVFGLKFPSVPFGSMPASVTFTDWATNADSATSMPAIILE